MCRCFIHHIKGWESLVKPKVSQQPCYSEYWSLMTCGACTASFNYEVLLQRQPMAAELNSIFSDAVNLHSDTLFLSHQTLVVVSSQPAVTRLCTPLWVPLQHGRGCSAVVNIIKIITLQGSNTTKKNRNDPPATPVLAAHYSAHLSFAPSIPVSHGSSQTLTLACSVFLLSVETE